MRISDWSSDVCSSDLQRRRAEHRLAGGRRIEAVAAFRQAAQQQPALVERPAGDGDLLALEVGEAADRRIRRNHQRDDRGGEGHEGERSEEHTYELQSLKRNSSAVLCLKKNK